MNLVGMLAKVAMGVIAAKGLGKVMGGGSGSGGGLAGALGGLLGGGSGQQGSQSGAGGLAGALGGLLGGGSGGQQGGGLGDLLNSMGGNKQSGGTSGGLGNMLNDAFQGHSPRQAQAAPDEDMQAEVLLRAMISAAKADGQVDAEEQKKITEHLGDITPDEVAFIRKEMQAPLDVQGLINGVPSGMEQQVYLMSLLAINLDSKTEAQYLDKLAKGLNISNDLSNAIHQKVGAPQLYR